MYVDFEKLTIAIDNLNEYYNKLKENYTNQSKNYDLLKDDTIWNGSAKINEILKYEEISNSYSTTLDNLNKQIEFLRSVKENYENQDKNFLNKTEEL